MRSITLTLMLGLAAVLPAAVRAQAVDPGRYRMVDLTHTLDSTTVYWPTSPVGFSLDRLAYGVTPGGWFYSANAFATAEHGGTHLDAPIHFDSTGWTMAEIPVTQLIAPAAVIDIARAAAADVDYRLTVGDVEAYEREHGRIRPGTIVLLRTGWSARWPDAKRYLGDDTPGDASHLHFPSYGPEAVRLLVNERRVAALGVDVASIDIGASTTFMVHRIAAAKNVPGLENLTNLDALPASGALVIALPVKLGGGSGGPVRAVALVPR